MTEGQPDNRELPTPIQGNKMVEESDACEASQIREVTEYSNLQKNLVVLVASLSTFVSPISASIFYPSLGVMSRDLNVAPSMLNLSITMFKIFQGIAPLITGNLSDHTGRRPTLIICLVIYIAVNTGLALQSSFSALMVLRCLQSACSGTMVIVGMATTSDVVTAAERGKYMAYTVLGSTVGPALGPLLGGILTQFLGWRSSFWFLVIFAGVLLLLVVMILPETCRAVVGNDGSPSMPYNRSVIQALYPLRLDIPAQTQPREPPQSRPSPWNSLKILLEKESVCLTLLSALIYAGYLAITTTLPLELETHYSFNALQIGLCFIPYGAGSVTSRWTAGKLTDWNLGRTARQLNFDVHSLNTDDMRLLDFPIESARAQIAIPLVYLAAMFIVSYGWTLHQGLNLGAPLVLLFCVAHSLSGVLSTLSTLIVDCHAKQVATATAAANFVRCLLGAGATAAAIPLINRIGFGWTASFLALLCLVASSLGWVVMWYGQRWRKEKAEKTEQVMDPISGSTC